MASLIPPRNSQQSSRATSQRIPTNLRYTASFTYDEPSSEAVLSQLSDLSGKTFVVPRGNGVLLDDLEGHLRSGDGRPADSIQSAGTFVESQYSRTDVQSACEAAGRISYEAHVDLLQPNNVSPEQYDRARQTFITEAQTNRLVFCCSGRLQSNPNASEGHKVGSRDRDVWYGSSEVAIVSGVLKRPLSSGMERLLETYEPCLSIHAVVSCIPKWRRGRAMPTGRSTSTFSHSTGQVVIPYNQMEAPSAPFQSQRYPSLSSASSSPSNQRSRPMPSALFLPQGEEYTPSGPVRPEYSSHPARGLVGPVMPDSYFITGGPMLPVIPARTEYIRYPTDPSQTLYTQTPGSENSGQYW